MIGSSSGSPACSHGSRLRRPVLARFPLLCLLSCLFTGLLAAPAASGMEVRRPGDQRSVLAPLADRSLLLAGVLAGQRLVAVGERGHVLLSDDGGRTFQQVEVPTRTTLTAVSFPDARRGWAAGHDQVILRTSDGGEQWEQVYADPGDERPVLDLWFRDGLHGYAVGAYGLFLETGDGGATWTSRRISEDDFHLNRLAPAGGDRLYLAAEAGMVYRSEDAGHTWVALDSPYEGSYFGILWLSGDTLLLYGLRGHLFRSEDGGESWQTLASGTEASLTDGVALADGRVVLVGMGGALLVSDDGGRSFSPHDREDRTGIAAVVQVPDGGLVTLGEAGARRVSDVP
ncbi:MAG: YCF48-related protein [Deferrisomatales bacterium]|nr:YCF48-related protein [Deferrisomatales bacterium]